MALPAGWRPRPLPSGSPASLAFERADGSLTGTFQVFDDAVTTNAERWYTRARHRYEQGAHQVDAVRQLTVGPLQHLTANGHAVHWFEFVTELKNGGAVTTRIYFWARRRAMDEIILSGESAAFHSQADAISALLAAHWP